MRVSVTMSTEQGLKQLLMLYSPGHLHWVLLRAVVYLV